MKNIHSDIVIPNYVGGKIETLYPLTGSQAQSFLMVYTPWINKFPYEGKDGDSLIKLFETFLYSTQCPSFLKYAYLKAKDAYFFELKQPTASFQPSATNINEAMKYDTDAENIIALTSLLPSNFNNNLFGLEQQYDLGSSHNWSEQTY